MWNRPLARCTAFTKVWSNASEGRSVRDTLDRVLVGADQGLTVWRPQAPTGYAVLGDCITLGDTQPTFQVSIRFSGGVVIAECTAYVSRHLRQIIAAVQQLAHDLPTCIALIFEVRE